MRGTPEHRQAQGRLIGIIPADAGNTTWSSGRGSEGEDHPRGCGEHYPPDDLWNGGRGSSPRMRGTRRGIAWSRYAPGIIPADAGNTHDGLIVAVFLQDHPRGCGEHVRLSAIVAPILGSSPRMRGTLGSRYAAVQAIGIIPADAGNTLSQPWWIRVSGDHPRGCGEHKEAFGQALLNRGSSPRMRGTHFYYICPIYEQRIIPADAGNTSYHHRLWLAWRDHPRGCGEHVQQPGETLAETGSSPRMRGTRNAEPGAFPGCRIIPADAGNTEAPNPHGYHNPDHPRGCGEHYGYSGKDIAKAGSSPRMRGTHLHSPIRETTEWIIPADAGNTFKDRSVDEATRDHPRGCGEHMAKRNAIGTCSGSSPRMRGTLRRSVTASIGKRDHPRGCGEHPPRPCNVL